MAAAPAWLSMALLCGFRIFFRSQFGQRNITEAAIEF
jgi:hypothetical protein